jgi:glycosyltransferase involved in cell wall biosynthesis
VISFIVPAFNEEHLLGATLQAIQSAGQASGEPFEIVVVDDASTDRTADIAREHGAIVVPVAHRQIAATRNSGARASQGEILIFVDADTIVSAEAVRAAAQAVRSGAIGGGCRFQFDGYIPLYARCLLNLALPIYRWMRLASGCFLFCTREAFESVGGFNEELYAAEEASMSQKLGRVGRFVILKESVTTSARKLRTHSAYEILGLIIRVLLAGPKSLQKRDGLEVWYGERRIDPNASSQSR